jgi:uncharacterized membrane protein YkvA (DUF1232 family)
MAASVTSWLTRPALLRTLVSHMRLAVRLVREPRVSMIVKVVPMLTALYVISPLDLVPDVIPILGQLDDLGVVLLSLEGFVKLCPAGVVDFHRGAIAANRRYAPMSARDEFIEAEWRRED